MTSLRFLFPRVLPLACSTFLLVGMAMAGAASIPWDGGTPPAGASQITLDAQTAAAKSLKLAGQEIPMNGMSGGFVITDYNAKKDVTLSGGQVEADGAGQKYHAEGDGLKVSATFTPGDGLINVTGEIENTRGGERAVILRYLVPVPAAGATFEDEFNHSLVITGTAAGLGTVYPLAAMTGQKWGVALAIPPTAPCMFGMTGSAKGLGVEYYLGLSPLPQKFPNKAAFSFVIYPAMPGWGFRSVLARYYQTYSDYYNTRVDGGGYYLWAEKGKIDYALPMFRLQGIPGHPKEGDFGMYQDRTKKAGLLTIEYIGATCRAISHLTSMPTDYDSSMKAYEDFKTAWNAMTEDQRKEKFHKFREEDMVNVIDRCVIEDAAGKDILAIRDASFSPNSVVFTMNPNPWLFKDKGWTTVGSIMTKSAAQFLKSDPVDGITVDSLGSNFPAHLNYRKDHYPYEQYPLTFDRQGRVAIHNMISHYELMEALRDIAHPLGKIIRANGMYRYTHDLSREENYNGTANGRFFIAALLDCSHREMSRPLERQDFDFGRIAEGRKLYFGALHRWDVPDGGELARIQINRSLPYTQFCLPEGGKSYLENKNGYYRDKDLLDWFLKNARILVAAGWQPMTRATVTHSDQIALERYGSGETNYFAMVSFGDKPLAVQVSIDLAALGLQDKNLKVTEIAQGASITQTTSGGTCQVGLTIDPSKAVILKLAPGK